MALKRSMETESGASVSYWTILREEIDHFVGTRTVRVGGFVSEEKRRAGKPALLALTFTFTADDFADCSDLSSVPRSAVYAAIRQGANSLRTELDAAADTEAEAAPRRPDWRDWAAALVDAQNC